VPDGQAQVLFTIANGEEQVQVVGLANTKLFWHALQVVLLLQV
jgi:hypothetical protein